IPCWSTVKWEFTKEVQTLLLALGIPTTNKEDISGWGQAPLYGLRLRNKSYTTRFLRSVGFMGRRKTEAVRQSGGEQSARYDYIYLAPEVLDTLVPARSAWRNAVAMSRKRHHGAITRRAAEDIYAATSDSR